MLGTLLLVDMLLVDMLLVDMLLVDMLLVDMLLVDMRSVMQHLLECMPSNAWAAPTKGAYPCRT
jgi:hypothetical protein